MRIHGRVGDWAVDLTVELDGAEWAQLRGVLPAVADEAPTAGALDGPQLFAELSALAGGEEAGKRLLVRLRHCPQVEVQAAGDAPVYRWTGAVADQ